MAAPSPSDIQQFAQSAHQGYSSNRGQLCMCNFCTELASLEQIKQDAVDEILNAKRKINFAHSIFVRALPIEVKVKTFEFCIQEKKNGAAKTNPLVLGAVCRDWRITAWGSPSLWASISIKLDIGCCPRHAVLASPDNINRVTLTGEWLARSMNRALRVDISVRTPAVRLTSPQTRQSAYQTLGPDSWDDLPPLVDGMETALVDAEACELIELITQESHRWQDLRICLPRDYLKLLGATLELDLPLLRSVEFRRCALHPRDAHDVLEYRLSIVDAPLLRKVVMDFYPADLPWEWLTHLLVNKFLVDDLMRVLHETPLLEHLTVQYPMWLRDDPDPLEDLSIDDPECIHLPRLRSLHFVSNPFRDREGPYEALIPFRAGTWLPSLEEFEFEGNKAAGSTEALEPIFQLASRYRDTLRRLVIRKAFFMGQRIVNQDLTKLHQLQDLEIDAASADPTSGITGAVLRALSLKTYGGGSPEFLPHLKVLSLTGAKDFGWNALADIFPNTTSTLPHEVRSAGSTMKETDEISVVRALRSVKVVCLASAYRTVDYMRPDELCRLFAVSARGCRLEVRHADWDEFDWRHYSLKSRSEPPAGAISDWLEASVKEWQESILWCTTLHETSSISYTTRGERR